MPNLVGIGLSQVPTNSMLGGLAYQDPEHASIKDLDLKNLSQINSEIANTAVDIFIYDTSKDSDGGAWRKRTQHTSWYNETLNTATRGSRREFPAVAVLVYGSGFINIYDGDDPDLPMWMTFDSGSFETFVTDIPTSISMLNGVLVWGCKHTNSGFAQNNLVICNFISEKTERISQAGNNYSGTDRTGIVNRNVWNNISTWIGNRPLNLVNYYINDVAMTVLPNAPIDASTGLPVPTIAVATDGGVSVIKDDGNVYDVIDTNSARKCYDVSFTKDHKLMHTGDLGAGSTHAANVFVTNILTADRAEYDNHSDLYRWYSAHSYYPRINGGDTFNTRVLDPLDVGGHHYAMADVGVSLIEDGTSSTIGNTDGMVAYITSDYNSGYQHGDIKGAFLSNTDDTNISGTDLVTNGDFSNGTTGWTANNAVITVTSEVLKVDDSANAGGDSQAYRTVTGLTIGKVYNVGVRHKSANQHRLWIGTGSGPLGSGNVVSAIYTAGSAPSFTNHYYTFTATTTSVTVALQVDGTGIAYYDWVYINESVEEDRSINNNPLQVFGLVTKSAVATGADLIAYSNFSASNHLRQPRNSDMNIGTGDAYVMIWYQTTTTSGTMMMISYEGGAIGTNDYGKPFNIRYENGSVRGWASHNAFNTFDDVNHGVSTADGNWHHAAWVKRGQVFELYVDGEFIGSDTGSVGSNALSDANSELVIGARKRGKVRGDSEEPWHNGSLALARIGKSAPSAEQIKKIYDDEKVLFQENAKATLYGSSDAVTALAYDETTDQLHVGTSSGRSDFQGLRRINNTTTAVTTAISAHDGFIVEQ